MAPRGYHVSTDAGRLDVEGTAGFLGTTYWAQGRPESIVRRSIEGSIAFGVYDAEEQVGFARVITDRATSAGSATSSSATATRAVALGSG